MLYGMARKTIRDRRGCYNYNSIRRKRVDYEQLNKLLKLFRVTTFSEETIDFTIQELD